MSEQFLTFPNIDPVALQLGPVSLHWYGIMYLLGFGFAYWLGTKRAKNSNGVWSVEQVDQLLFNGFWGVVLGEELVMCSFIALTVSYKILSIYFVFGKGECRSTAVYLV